MGWRAWDAYEREAEQRWRALPWRERFTLSRIVIFAAIVGLALTYLWLTVR